MTGVWQTTVPKTKTGKQVGTAYLSLFALKLKQNCTDYNVELSYQTTRSGMPVQNLFLPLRLQSEK